jgi:hypothetical protein
MALRTHGSSEVRSAGLGIQEAPSRNRASLLSQANNITQQVRLSLVGDFPAG